MSMTESLTLTLTVALVKKSLRIPSVETFSMELSYEDSHFLWEGEKNLNIDQVFIT